MRVINKLYLKIVGRDKIIYFGIPSTKDELDKMFRLRYDVYNSRNYLRTDLIQNSLDRDKYDLQNKCDYFIAKIDDRIIGTLRLIRDEILPTEGECFKFKEPPVIEKIPRNQRSELSRLVIIPYNKKKKQYLPRNLILLFLIKCLMEFSLENDIYAGYSFITKSLYRKTQKLKIPLHIIQSYIQTYPKEGLLSPYFHQKGNPIIPVYYLRSEIREYIGEIFKKRKLFKEISNKEFVLRSTLYNKFLRLLKII